MLKQASLTMNDRMRLRTASEIASLVLANAMIFHEELARNTSDIVGIRRLLDHESFRDALQQQWKAIQAIDYVPIFHVAHEILLDLPEWKDTDRVLRHLAEAVMKVSTERAALRHDLMGRIYHKLLLDAKYLGTYYTSVAAATLLLKLTLDPKRWDLGWSDFDALKSFQIADLSCGTGTLLMAAQQATTDNYVRATVDGGDRVTESGLRQLHKLLMEEMLFGYDVLASAVHLTASTLAILAPEIVFEKMNLFCLPLGVRPDEEVYLGSVDFAVQGDLMAQIDLMGEGRGASRITGKGGLATSAPLPKLDLCVMNPPFTRSVGGNLLFGSAPAGQRKIMQKKLAGLLKRGEGTSWALQASSTAGLGSVFVAVADKYLKNRGRMALVLPQAVASGVAWKKTRELFAKNYVLEMMIVSHDPQRWNFSESTDLSEILLILQKNENGSAPEGAVTRCINLWKNTPSVFDALSLASAVTRTAPAEIQNGHGVASLVINKETRAEVVSVPWDDIKDTQWYSCLFAQTELVRTSHHLRNGLLYITPAGVVAELPLTYLSSLGELGPDRRDIYDGFSISKSRTSYPAFWSHEADHVISMAMEPNAYLQPLNKARKDRNLRNVELLWPRAGRIMIAERMWFNTQRTTAIRLQKAALSNVWWPFRLNAEDECLEKTLLLWMNCTLGTIMLMSHRVPTRGAWVQFKKPHLAEMPVIDVWRLSPQQLQQFAKDYDKLCTQELRPLPNMATDPVRTAIDDCISEALHLPSLTRLRESLAREPVISLQPLYRS